VAHWAVVLTHSPARVYTDPCSLPTPCDANENESLMASIVTDMSMTLDGYVAGDYAAGATASSLVDGTASPRAFCSG
jgi:hypothetical protein